MPQGEGALLGVSAMESYSIFNNQLSESERRSITTLTRHHWEQLLAARSEDARLRLVHRYIDDIHRALGRKEQC
jgi:hypothetical protein